jgi:hypothetical protein
MRLLTVTLYEFRQFLQILMWIAIPLTIVTLTITVVVHYWRKKRKKEDDFLQPSPDINSMVLPRLGEMPDEGDPAYQGMLWLRSKYQQDIELADQKQEALKTAYAELEKKHLDLLSKIENNSTVTIASAEKENDFQKKLEEYESTIAGLQELLNQQQVRQQEMVNRETTIQTQTHDTLKTSLQQVADYDMLKQQLDWAEQEKQSLKKNIHDQDVLRDAVEEKTRHIGFLQNQLEERIKLFHEVEYRSREEANQVKVLQDRIEGIIKENQQHQENVDAKSNHIEKLEKEIHAMQQQSVSAQSAFGEKLEQEIQKANNLNAKLAFSRRLLQKIQQEIGTSFEKQMILYTDDTIPHPHKDDQPKISAWIESPSEEAEFEHII